MSNKVNITIENEGKLLNLVLYYNKMVLVAKFNN